MRTSSHSVFVCLCVWFATVNYFINFFQLLYILGLILCRSLKNMVVSWDIFKSLAWGLHLPRHQNFFRLKLLGRQLFWESYLRWADCFLFKQPAALMTTQALFSFHKSVAQFSNLLCSNNTTKNWCWDLDVVNNFLCKGQLLIDAIVFWNFLIVCYVGGYWQSLTIELTSAQSLLLSNGKMSCTWGESNPPCMWRMCVLVIAGPYACLC